MAPAIIPCVVEPSANWSLFYTRFYLLVAMVRYVIEKLKPRQEPNPNSGEGDIAFSILELPGRKQVGTLRRSGGMFTAESKKHRNTSEATSGLLVLKMAFRSDHFFIQNGEILAKLTEKDLA